MLHSVWLPRGCINSKHCLPLCASGLGSKGTIAWKNVIFKNNPFPLSNAISKPFPVYSALWDFWCESICHGFHRCIKQGRQTSSSENKCQFSKFALSHPRLRTTEFDFVLQTLVLYFFVLIAETQQGKPIPTQGLPTVSPSLLPCSGMNVLSQPENKT